MEYELIDTGECQARALVRVHDFVHRGYLKGLVGSFAVSWSVVILFVRVHFHKAVLGAELNARRICFLTILAHNPTV